MALFPAYEDKATGAEEGLKIATDLATIWLQNPSFVPLSDDKLTVSSAPVEKEVVALSDTVDLGSDSSISFVSVTRKKKRKKEKCRKNRRKRLLMRSDQRHTTKIDNIFLDAQNTSLSAVKLYDIDTRRDLENFKFETTYKRQKAKFRTKKYSTLLGSCALLSSLYVNLRDSNHKIFKWRYFRFRKMDMAPKFVTSSSFAKFENSEELFLPILPSRMNVDGKDLVYDEKIRMYRLANDEEMVNSCKAKGEHNALSRLLVEKPNDIDLWLRFLKDQDLQDWNFPKKSKTALLERKLSILEKAIQLNPQSYQLKIMQIDLGIQIGWNFETINEFFRKLEFQHANCIEIWQRRLEIDYFPFSQFTVTKIVNLYSNCLQKLYSIMSGSLVTHPCQPGTGRFFVSVLVGLVNFYLQSGHTEKSLALCQALLEFNFYAPLETKNSGLEEKRCLFEPFWDSGAPRIGEENSRGREEKIIETTITRVKNSPVQP
uniref:Uncharacterized protein n=1 Tax=Romanomermis culicivorax TaxID=13658 RepID=A0A915HWJ9_ROMCU